MIGKIITLYGHLVHFSVPLIVAISDLLLFFAEAKKQNINHHHPPQREPARQNKNIRLLIMVVMGLEYWEDIDEEEIQFVQSCFVSIIFLLHFICAYTNNPTV